MPFATHKLSPVRLIGSATNTDTVARTMTNVKNKILLALSVLVTDTLKDANPYAMVGVLACDVAMTVIGAAGVVKGL